MNKMEILNMISYGLLFLSFLLLAIAQSNLKRQIKQLAKQLQLTNENHDFLYRKVLKYDEDKTLKLNALMEYLGVHWKDYPAKGVLYNLLEK